MKLKNPDFKYIGIKNINFDQKSKNRQVLNL